MQGRSWRLGRGGFVGGRGGRVAPVERGRVTHKGGGGGADGDGDFEAYGQAGFIGGDPDGDTAAAPKETARLARHGGNEAEGGKIASRGGDRFYRLSGDGELVEIVVKNYEGRVGLTDG